MSTRNKGKRKISKAEARWNAEHGVLAFALHAYDNWGALFYVVQQRALDAESPVESRLEALREYDALAVAHRKVIESARRRYPWHFGADGHMCEKWPGRKV